MQRQRSEEEKRLPQYMLDEQDKDDARDRARFGGPITDAMLHTALRIAAYDPSANPQHHFNLATLASHINSWLHPVNK